MSDTLHGIVLAAGYSNRMGFSKPLAPFGDRTFLRAVCDCLAACGTVRIHVVVNAGLAGILKSSPESGHPLASFVVNAEPALGQIRSVQLGLAAAQDGGARWAVVALADQPAVRPQTVGLLAVRAAAEPGSILMPTWGGRSGHPYVIPERFFSRFTGAGPGETSRDVLRALSSSVVRVETDDPAVLTDADSLADMGATPRPWIR